MSRTRDPKELWAEYFDEARADGLTEDGAGEKADARLADYYAGLVDDAKDRRDEWRP